MRSAQVRQQFLRIVAILTICLLSACEGSLYQTTGPSHYGVVFSAFPPALGGGIKDGRVPPGTSKILMPWQQLYTMDTSVQTISWGGKGQGDKAAIEDFVETRALDGNEVGLSVTVQYHVNPLMVGHVIQRVAIEEERIRQIVAFAARSDIRTHMNVLNTRDFFSPAKRQAAVSQVKTALNTRLNPEGIIVDAVIYIDHKFERVLEDGSKDSSYQQQIDQTQATYQQAEQERKKIRTVIEQKKQEYNEAQADYNRKIEAVEGEKRQAMLRGDAYFQVKDNEAQAIKLKGMAKVEGLKEQIAALQGDGGRALLRLDLIRALVKSNPRFILLNSQSRETGSINVNKVDTNDLIKQAGIFSALQASDAALSPPPTAAPAQAIGAAERLDKAQQLKQSLDQAK